MIDNFKLLRDKLVFKNDEWFYYIEVIQRKKDGNEVPNSSNKQRRITSFYISSLEEYDKQEQMIKEFCDKFNARAYIRITPCSWETVALSSSIRFLKRIEDGNVYKVHNIFDSECCTTKSPLKKLWLIDSDTKEELKLDPRIIVLYEVPTNQGIHYIVYPFDKRIYKEDNLKTSNPLTLLYYNEKVSNNM
jgi:hypothetical protein